jgi:predicted O-linked N-acetylglucosamine transferase (SPINDLY family)
MTNEARAKELFFSALAQIDSGNFAGAETNLRGALAIVPDRLSALSNLATALFYQGKYAEALPIAGRAVQLDPSNAEMFVILAACLRNADRQMEALDAIDKAIHLAPNDFSMRLKRGTLLVDMRLYDRAIPDFETALRVRPDDMQALALLIAAKRNACDWKGISSLTAAALDGLRAGRGYVDPFILLSLPSTSADQLASARAYIKNLCPPVPPLYAGERYNHRRIRVAYLSGDFRQHPLSQLMAGVFEHHDRTAFETVGISYGPNDRSAMRMRIEHSFDRFVDARGRSDKELATLVRHAEIDIAVDLAGLTGRGVRAFAHRPAPVQATYLGYPGTTGSEHVDYLLADSAVIPPGEERHYAENIIRLPHSYFATDNRLEIATETPSRRDIGLPEEGFVFCCFNSSYKFTPEVFDIWMALLREVEGSVLWLLASNPAVAENLKREAEARGIRAERLIFAGFAATAHHLARHRLADLFLDNLPYNAHTTACDALWAGLPVVTCIGDTFAARVAASLLRAMGLPDLITYSLTEYAALARQLAGDRARLSALKLRVAENRKTAPLFDTATLTRQIEQVYTEMLWRTQN